MNSVANSAVLGLVAVPPMATYATSNNKGRYVDRAVCQRGTARQREEVLQLQLQRQRQASETQQWEIQAEEQQILQSCRFRDSDCFVEGAMIASSLNEEVLLKEEQP
jgi:hypothetical protein